MTISAHLIIAVLLLGTAGVTVICEAAIRRRVRNYRSLQVLSIGSALVFVPANVTAATPGHLPETIDTLALIGAIATLLVQLVAYAVAWLPAPRPTANRRVLAVGAHPDDLELACGGTLSRLADSGYEVHTLVMSPGSVGGNSKVRPDEATRGAALMGATRCEVLEFPDTKLSTHAAELVQAIEARIKAFNPDIILTHSANDQHQDHAAVHLATLRAGRRHPAILCYESPSVTAAFSPTVFVDIDDYVDSKNAAISAHRDQASKPYMADDNITAMAVFRGAQGRLDSAEAFEAVRVPGFAGVL